MYVESSCASFVDGRTLDCAITPCTTGLYVVGVDARCGISSELTESALLAAIKVDIFEVEGMDMTWNVTKDCEADVDEEVSTTSRDHENADGRNEDGDEDDEEGGRGVSHFVVIEAGIFC